MRQRSKPDGRDAASEASGGTRLGAQHESAATPEAAGAPEKAWTKISMLRYVKRC
jgi:hypothetical protein